MSYRETNIYVSLVSSLLVLGYFLVKWLPLYRGGNLESGEVFRLWAVVIVASIILNILGNILTSIVLSIGHAIQTHSDKEPRFIEDERDKLVDLKGTKASYLAFSIGVFLSMLTFVFNQPPLLMFSLIIFFSVTAEIIGDVWQLYLYRRGLIYG